MKKIILFVLMLCLLLIGCSSNKKITEVYSFENERFVDDIKGTKIDDTFDQATIDKRDNVVFLTYNTKDDGKITDTMSVFIDFKTVKEKEDFINYCISNGRVTDLFINLDNVKVKGTFTEKDIYGDGKIYNCIEIEEITQ